jgi:hypothetical protein
MARTGWEIKEIPAPMKPTEVPKFERDSQGKPIGVDEPVVEINPEDIPF